MTTTIVLVRHGQTEWNRVERFRGRFDIELNETGLAQARLTAAEIIRVWKPAAIFSSPLMRAMQTAGAIAAVSGLTVTPAPGLLDIDYGSWQGLSPQEVQEQWPCELDNWYNHPEQAHIPGGETLALVQERAFSCLDRIVEQHQHQVIVFVSHTVVNRLILLKVLGAGTAGFWRLQQQPCAINVIEKEALFYTIRLMNATGHLQTIVD